MRIDKWLWAARFFKTRSLAAQACDLGRVTSNGIDAKPSREVRAGDQIRVRNAAGEFHVEVLALSMMRGPAAVAQTLYRESPESVAARIKAAEERKAMALYEVALRAGGETGRPSKKDRREIDRFRGRRA